MVAEEKGEVKYEFKIINKKLEILYNTKKKNSSYLARYTSTYFSIT
jgi:hypothetical protein